MLDGGWKPTHVGITRVGFNGDKERSKETNH